MDFNDARMLQALTDTTDAIVMAIDADGRILFVNNAFTRIMGFAAEEVMGQEVWNLRAPHQRTEAEAGYRRAVASGDAGRIELKWIAKDGTSRVLSFSTRRLRDENGDLNMVVGTAIDLTAERLLARRSNWYRQMLQEALESVIMVDPRGCIEYVNPAAEKLFGYSSQELLGVSNQIFIPEEDREAMEAFARRIRDTMKPQEISTHRVRKDGSRVPVHLKVSPLQDIDGTLYGLVGVSIDTSAQIEMQRRERAAIDHAHMLATIVENLPEPVFHADQHGVLRYLNGAVEDVYGYSPAELLGRHMAMVRPDDRKGPMSEFLDHVRQSDKPSVIETVALNKQQRRFPVELRVTRLNGNAGEDLGIVGLARNIADRKRAEEEMRKRADTDLLTGLSNRHALEAKGLAEFRRADRYHHDLAVLLCDLDHFKTVNDTYGHLGGDAALRRFAEILQNNLRRPSDVAARIGGEEFCVILPETSLASARQVAERIRRNTGQMVIKSGEHAFSVTVSIGVSYRVRQDSSIDSIVQRADDALYEAKNNGRNRVEIDQSLSGIGLSIISG